MDNRKVRGSVINGYLNFIQHKWGIHGCENCLEDLGINGRIKDGYFYPDKVKTSILKWIKEYKGDKYIIEGGKYLVSHLGILSWLVRFSTPMRIAKKAEREYKEIYTFGNLKVGGEKGKIRVFIKDHSDDRVNCLAFKGVLRGMLDITKTDGEIKEIKCQLNGDDHCEFLVIY